METQKTPQPQPIIVQTQKSPSTAAILALFFGPLGMLYSTVTGAVVMFIITAIVGFVTLGIGLLVTLPICSIWAYVSVKNQNQKQLNNIQQ